MPDLTALIVRTDPNGSLPMDRPRAILISRDLRNAIVPTLHAAYECLGKAWMHKNDGAGRGAYNRIAAEIHKRSRMPA